MGFYLYQMISVGLLAPVSWNISRWTAATAAMINGRMKWKVKDCVRVALSTEKPPQIHWARFILTYEIAERRLVIPVAPPPKYLSSG